MCESPRNLSKPDWHLANIRDYGRKKFYDKEPEYLNKHISSIAWMTTDRSNQQLRTKKLYGMVRNNSKNIEVVNGHLPDTQKLQGKRSNYYQLGDPNQVDGAQSNMKVFGNQNKQDRCINLFTKNNEDTQISKEGKRCYANYESRFYDQKPRNTNVLSNSIPQLLDKRSRDLLLCKKKSVPCKHKNQECEQFWDIDDALGKVGRVEGRNGYYTSEQIEQIKQLQNNFQAQHPQVEEDFSYHHKEVVNPSITRLLQSMKKNEAQTNNHTQRRNAQKAEMEQQQKQQEESNVQSLDQWEDNVVQIQQAQQKEQVIQPKEKSKAKKK